MVDKIFVATRGFILHNNKVLILQESTEYKDGTNAGKFDLVGGRLNPGEHFQNALLREIKEESGLDVTIKRPFHVDEWRPTVRGEQWQIVCIFFICEASTNKVTLSKDHTSFKWIDPIDYKKYDLLPQTLNAFQVFNNKSY